MLKEINEAVPDGQVAEKAKYFADLQARGEYDSITLTFSTENIINEFRLLVNRKVIPVDLEKLESKIDEKLRTAYFDGKDNVSFFINEKVPPSYENALRLIYQEVGWHSVGFSNSSENNEREGICKVTLYRKLNEN